MSLGFFLFAPLTWQKIYPKYTEQDSQDLGMSQRRPTWHHQYALSAQAAWVRCLLYLLRYPCACPSQIFSCQQNVKKIFPADLCRFQFFDGWVDYLMFDHFCWNFFKFMCHFPDYGPLEVRHRSALIPLPVRLLTVNNLDLFQGNEKGWRSAYFMVSVSVSTSSYPALWCLSPNPIFFSLKFLHSDQ